MTINGYTSRSIPSPKIYENILEDRMKAKAEGNKAKANALKLVCNTTYGAMLNRYNPLYDPLMARSVCISGQLYLLELAEHLYTEIEGLKLIALNTDGIMIEFDDSQMESVKSIIDEWQERTGFELEEDVITKLVQNNVNNYVEVVDGKVKCKGGYLVKGIAPAGAFNINNNYPIVAEALKKYFVNGTPVRETIYSCDDIHQFQIIAKIGSMYKDSYHVQNGEKTRVQKVNRVYASADPNNGTLMKIKAETDAEAKIGSLPERCVIDNNNHLSIDDIDKNWYVELAEKQIGDFLGTTRKKGKKTMATATKNIYAKLLQARSEFLKLGTAKGGKNMTLKYQYFELDDIVPNVMKVCEMVGIVPVTMFDENTAVLKLVNTDNPEDIVVFTVPLAHWQGNNGVNPIQVMGATVTYYRRYLYMIAFDIIEPDEIEPSLNKDNTISAPEKPVAPVAEKKPTVPATPAKREEVKKELANADGNATDLQLGQLRTAFSELLKKKPETEEMITQIALKTEGFTKISKTDCEALLKKVGEMLG